MISESGEMDCELLPPQGAAILAGLRPAPQGPRLPVPPEEVGTAHAHPRVAAALADPVASPLPPRTTRVRVQRTVHSLTQ